MGARGGGGVRGREALLQGEVLGASSLSGRGGHGLGATQWEGRPPPPALPCLQGRLGARVSPQLLRTVPRAPRRRVVIPGWPVPLPPGGPAPLFGDQPSRCQLRAPGADSHPVCSLAQPRTAPPHQLPWPSGHQLRGRQDGPPSPPPPIPASPSFPPPLPPGTPSLHRALRTLARLLPARPTPLGNGRLGNGRRPLRPHLLLSGSAQSPGPQFLSP